MAFVELYLPLVLCLICGLCIFIIRKGSGRTVLKLKPFGQIVELEMPISNLLILRSVLVAMIPLLLLFYFFYDYSAFFPQHIRMEVFYDQGGIEKSLTPFTEAEISGLQIPKEYRRYQDQYFAALDEEVRRILDVPQFFSIKKGTAHSAGQVYNVVEKVGGWQKYYLGKSEGELTHVLEVPNSPQRRFYTRFERLPTGHDYIQLTFGDIIWRHSVMLRTEYKQILVESKLAEGIGFKLSVVEATKVKIFPWPSISNTVYFANFRAVGLVPIAYASYRW